jgi:uncharacterized protein YneF (UPF0154 family)
VRYNVGVRVIAVALLIICALLLGFAIGYWYGQTIIELLNPHIVPIIWGRVIA